MYRFETFRTKVKGKLNFFTVKTKKVGSQILTQSIQILKLLKSILAPLLRYLAAGLFTAQIMFSAIIDSPIHPAPEFKRTPNEEPIVPITNVSLPPQSSSIEEHNNYFREILARANFFYFWISKFLDSQQCYKVSFFDR